MNIYKNTKIMYSSSHEVQNEWKRYGLYYMLPMSKNKKILKKMQFKIGYKNQGTYYDDIIKDFIYFYSNGFQKDSFERIKTIQSIEKHKPRIWINKKDNKYVKFVICDFARISYKEHDVLRYVVKSRLIQDGFWIFQYSPRKNYQEFLHNVVKKKKLLRFFTEILNITKKKLYFFFKLSTKVFSMKGYIYFIKKLWVFNFRFIFLTSSGYRFMRKSCYWFTMEFFTGLFWIIKGPAKDGLKYIINISYPLYTYYNSLFLEKWMDDYFIYLVNFIYKFFSDFAFESVELTYISQKIKYRRSNWYLRRLSRYIVQRFRNSQNRLYNYFQIINSSISNNLKFFSNYLFFYKYFDILQTFDGVVFKDIDKLSFMEDYTSEEKVIIFKIIVCFLQAETFRKITKQIMLRSFNRYFRKKSILIGRSIVNIVKNFFAFKQFCLEGFFFNNFKDTDYYQDWFVYQRRIIHMYKYYALSKRRILFFSKNIFFDFTKNRYKKSKKFISSKVFWKYKINCFLKALHRKRRSRYSFYWNRIRFFKFLILNKNKRFKNKNLKNKFLIFKNLQIKMNEKFVINLKRHCIFLKKLIKMKNVIKLIPKNFKILYLSNIPKKIQENINKLKKVIKISENYGYFWFLERRIMLKKMQKKVKKIIKIKSINRTWKKKGSKGSKSKKKVVK